MKALALMVTGPRASPSCAVSHAMTIKARRARQLNRAARSSWPLLMAVSLAVRFSSFMIECKTARMDLNERFNDTLFNLVNIHSRVGGLGARGMLVSYRSMKDGESQLARALRVRVVQGPGIPGLRDRIIEWARGAGGVPG